MFEMPSSAASSRDDQCVTPSRAGGAPAWPARSPRHRSTAPGPAWAGPPARPPPRGIPLLPGDHRRLGRPGPPRDLIRPDPVRGQQHDPGPLGQPGPDRRRADPRGQHLTITRRNLHLHSQRHKPSSAGHDRRSRFLAHGILGSAHSSVMSVLATGLAGRWGAAGFPLPAWRDPDQENRVSRSAAADLCGDVLNWTRDSWWFRAWSGRYEVCPGGVSRRPARLR